MKLCFSTLGCPDWDIWTVADRAKEYGFDGVELRVKGDRHVDVSLSKNERTKILERFRQNGVKIVCLSGYTVWNNTDTEVLEQNKQKMSDYIELASDLEAEYIRTFIGIIDEEAVLREDIEKAAAKYLNICGREAEEKGIKILIETHDSFGTGSKVANVMRYIDTAGVAVLWDVQHSLHENESIEDTYSLVGDKIEHMHIKDERVDSDGKTEHCFVGDGIVPVKEIAAFMEAKKYKGYYSLEWEKFWIPEMEDPEKAFPKYCEYMRSL